MEWNRDMHEMEWNKDKMKCGNLYTCKYIKQAQLGIQCVLSFTVLLASSQGFPVSIYNLSSTVKVRMKTGKPRGYYAAYIN